MTEADGIAGLRKAIGRSESGSILDSTLVRLSNCKNRET